MKVTRSALLKSIRSALTDTSHMGLALTGACAGLYLVDTLPFTNSLPHTIQLPLSGAAALLGFIYLERLADGLTPNPPYQQPTIPTLLFSDPEVMNDLLGEAARSDAAHRAATAARMLDYSDAMLTKPECWLGNENGDARLLLTREATLQHRRIEGPYGPAHEFTLLLTGSETGIPVHTMAEIFRHCTASAEAPVDADCLPAEEEAAAPETPEASLVHSGELTPAT